MERRVLYRLCVARKLVGVFAVQLIVPAAEAAIIFSGSPGPAPPPTTLGPYEMTAFPPDDRPLFVDITSVPSPLGGELGFSIPMRHLRIGAGWGSWGHGYTGDVYWDHEQPQMRLDLSPGTTAFYFYAKPPGGGDYFTAVAQDGTSSPPTFVYWADPMPGFGFYATEGSFIESITVSTLYGWGFAVGEFSIAVPEPGSLGLLALGGLAVVRRRR